MSTEANWAIALLLVLVPIRFEVEIKAGVHIGGEIHIHILD